MVLMVRRNSRQRSNRRKIERSSTAYSTATASAPSDDPLLKSAEWLRLAEKGSPMGLWYWNEDTGRVFWDAKACDMFGVSPRGEKTLEIFYACLHPDDRDRVKDVWRHQLEHQLPCDLEYRSVRPDGSIRFLHALGSGYYDADGKPIRMVGVVFDVTTVKDAEQRLDDARRRLAEASQRTTLATMTASIAHELNQPLGAIVLCGNAGLRLLTSAEWDRDQICSALTRIVEDGRRASEILARIRAMFRRDRQEALPLNVNELVRDVLSLARGELTSRRITLHVKLSEQIENIVGDRVLLQQVVLNLVMNAVEAMTPQPDTRHHLTVQTRPGGSDAVLITIADNGPGIPPEHMNRIFEAFFTTKADGTGMGLSICQSIVEAHGGRLWATARAPRGTRFHVRLPLSV
jgi:PAS domain S-box-containing protein